MLFCGVLHGLFVDGEFAALEEGGADGVLGVLGTEGGDYEVGVDC